MHTQVLSSVPKYLTFEVLHPVENKINSNGQSATVECNFSYLRQTFYPGRMASC